jgi:hypothetical protein
MVDSIQEAKRPKKFKLHIGGHDSPENVKRILMGEPKLNHPANARRRAHATPQTGKVVQFRRK